MLTKIISGVLVAVILFMGVKQGLAMITGKPEMLEMFDKLGLQKATVMVLGIITLLGTVLIALPKTFLWGNFIMATTILMILCLQLSHNNLKGAAMEVPFLLLNLIVIYLRHPLDN
ncbi:MULTISPECIES: DoxX family protein [Flagellimonas]|uniref:DoxX family protein n=1 Tax=Flagellimonas hadalis TaxID=2597517 RepID=A0A5N5ISR0_9FLAO|nr:DoxX family protein [Allomuricauda hadalis]KAB5490910.1 hypothetical protein FOT42_005630 [Allomuricauda hadalis]RUA14022.1 MAG: hypothetical protein DSY83_10365 [Flavobacteriia bacterium]